MKRLLLVTGQLAYSLVKSKAKEGRDVKADVIALPMAVAALMRPNYIVRELEKRREELRGYDAVMIPGMVQGDVKVIEERLKVKAYKGPKYASDIPITLNLINSINLSTIASADELIKEEIIKRAVREVEYVEKRKNELLKKEWNFEISKLAIGKDFPSRIMAEIVDAPLLSDDELRERALYYLSQGADIIDVGMLANEQREIDAYRCVKVVKEVCRNKPVSIDSMNVDEIKQGIKAGADIVLSIDAGNMEDLASYANECAFVIIPTNFKKGYYPKKLDERIKALESNIRRAKELGFTKILADIILDPLISPGFLDSLIGYYEFRKRNPNIILFIGVGNVIELTDADTTGMSALLAGIARELDAGVILTTEVSNKAKGNVKELAIASKMMFVAKRKKCIPKDIGFDLLFIKDKVLKDEPYDKDLEKSVKVIEVRKKKEYYSADPKGCFKILLDRDNKEIVLIYYPTYKLNEPRLILKGKDALSLCKEVIKRNLISKLEHAGYLGLELQKAEIALRLGKSYVQDSNLFNRSL